MLKVKVVLGVNMSLHSAPRRRSANVNVDVVGQYSVPGFPSFPHVGIVVYRCSTRSPPTQVVQDPSYGRSCAAEVPFNVLLAFLPFKHLLDVARLHDVVVPQTVRSISALLTLLTPHVCDSRCGSVLSLFNLPTTTLQFMPPIDPVRFACSSALCDDIGRAGPDVDISEVMMFPPVVGTPPLPRSGRLRFVAHMRMADVFIRSAERDTFTLNIPFSTLVTLLDYRHLVSLAATHRVYAPFGLRTHRGLYDAVTAHACDDVCGRRYAVFTQVSPADPDVGFPSESGNKATVNVSAGLPIQTGYPIKKDTSLPPAPHGENVPVFPPTPLSLEDTAGIVAGWCDDITPSALAEAACAVCGELVRKTLLNRLDLADLDLSLLCRYGIAHCPEGVPLLYDNAVFNSGAGTTLDICTTCFNAIRRRRVPMRSLANGTWIGSIPLVLSQLTFVEKLLVSKYRHNACVVEVRQGNGAPGQRKMRANAIIFPQPIDKVYSALPPPRHDLDAVLAVLFVGPCIPVEKDYRRTPLLVRQQAVFEALNWLINHHSDYADVVISHENLASYSETEPPVCVLHSTSDGLRETEDMAVYDHDEEPGVREGNCEFVVRGVSMADLVDMPYEVKVAEALKHFNLGHGMLAVGHGEQPASIFHNPQLFPGLFPWLFPYGHGGFENEHIQINIPRIQHVRHLLMYADRRFQQDEYFPFLVFNHKQIRGSSRGGYLLTERRNFDSVVDKILNIDNAALQALIDRAKKGVYVRPETPAERSCFDLLSVLDHVAGHVPASLTHRKHQRTELKSMIMTLGVPVFFITFAPVDFKNPLCLYYCGQEISLLSSSDTMPDNLARMRAVANNPVACARFFHLVVSLFLKHVLRCGSNYPGLFGVTRAFYGTVEEQKRLRLHLHLAVWIACSLSPQEIRDRVLDDPHFRSSLITWLEQCHTGDFSTGRMEDIRARINLAHAENRNGEEDEHDSTEVGYMDPVLQLPVPPPHSAQTDALPTDLRDESLQHWYTSMLEVSDDIVYRSNIHSEDHSKGCKRSPQSQCRARFPREQFPSTIVDPNTGAIRFKKQEQWINTFNPILSYLLHCNTDVTCLLSGTQVRAVIAYVTDYMTKGGFQQETVFNTIKAVTDRQEEVVANSSGDHAAARRVIVKIVNALSAMQQIGGPTVCAYLLGQPDHYTDQVFKTFYWTSYVSFAASTVVTEMLHGPVQNEPEKDENVVLGVDGNMVVPYYRVNDYCYRPREYESMSLYSYLTTTTLYRLRRKSSVVNEDSFHEEGSDSKQDLPRDGFALLRDHPLHSTHTVCKIQGQLSRSVCSQLYWPSSAQKRCWRQRDLLSGDACVFQARWMEDR